MSRDATRPEGRPFDLWGQRGWPHQEVVGESNYTAEIHSLFDGQSDPAGSELTLTAQLILEPHNKYDRNAVSVRINGRTVGYLPREDAAAYAPALSAIVERGWTPQVAARVWGGERSSYDYDRRGRAVERTEFVGSVSLDLAEPHLLAPVNHPPTDAHALLPPGNAIQVTGEEGHMAALVPLLSSSGECWVHATLHELVDESTKTPRSLVEARIDGAMVGRLTPKMSGELLPAIRHLASMGAATACRAILKGNTLKADVVLHTARANQLPQEWLDAPPIQGVPRQVNRDTATEASSTGTPPPGAETGSPAPDKHAGQAGVRSERCYRVAFQPAARLVSAAGGMVAAPGLATRPVMATGTAGLAVLDLHPVSPSVTGRLHPCGAQCDTDREHFGACRLTR